MHNCWYIKYKELRRRVDELQKELDTNYQADSELNQKVENIEDSTQASQTDIDTLFNS